MPHVAVTSAALLIALTSTAALAVTPPAVTGGGAAPAAAPASPASAAAVKEPPLKEIGRVTSSAACTNIVIRANSVIGASLRNDQTVALAVTTLRRVDLDTTNPIDRNKAVHEIDRIATELRNSAGNADAQIKKLRELSDESTDPVRKADLKEFADALGGALQRQKRIGADLQRMLVIQEGREARAEIHEVVGHGMPEYRQVFAYGDSQFELGHFNAMAQAAAKDIEERTLSISADEAKAAEHIAGAVNGCS